MSLHAAVHAPAQGLQEPPQDAAALDRATAARLAAWLGNSALVDKHGRPTVFYRGESGGELFTVFDPRRTRESGFFFTTDLEVARKYANGGQPRAFYLRAPRVLDLTQDTPENQRWVAKWAKSFDSWIDRCSGEEADAWYFLESGQLYDYEGDWSAERWRDLQASASLEFDAVILPDFDRERGIFPACVMFDPHNIKSATHNVGTFDPNNPDIRFASAPARHAHRSRSYPTSHGSAALTPSRTFMADDQVRQQAWILQQAALVGSNSARRADDLDALALNEPALLQRLMAQWRQDHPVSHMDCEGVLVSDATLQALARGDLAAALQQEAAALPPHEDILRALASRLQAILHGQSTATLVPQLRKPDGGVAFGACSPDGRQTWFSMEEGVRRETLFHEAVHAATQQVLLARQQDLPPLQQAAVARLLQVWNIARRDKDISAEMTEFAKRDLSEFVAEALSCDRLQLALNGRPWRLGSLWTEFKSTLLQTLGLRERDSLMAATMAAVDALMAHPSTGRAAGQTDTAAFHRWFADSKAVDEAGAPLVLFHGTGRDFANFNADAALAAPSHVPLPGFFFTPDPHVASHFAETAAKRAQNAAGKPFAPVGANVVPVYLSLRKPLEIDASAAANGGRMPSERVIEARLRQAQELGCDGAIIRGWSDGSGPVQYVVFNASQVKSAIGNRGTFDANDVRLCYRSAGPMSEVNEAVDAAEPDADSRRGERMRG